jgi:hypothetical protein
VGALEIPSWRVTSAALEALARVGQDAREAQRAVLDVATSHWSQRVRWRAVTTMRFLRQKNDYDQLEAVMKAIDGGHSYAEFLESGDALADPVSHAFATVPPNDSTARENTPVCAWNRRPGEPVEVTWEGGEAILPPLGSRQARARRERHADRIPRTTLEGLGIGFDVLLAEAVQDIRRKGDDYLVAACAGEFGGGLLQVTPDGKVAVLREGCFMALREVGDAIWVFEGAAHLGEGYGRIWRLDEGDASWVPVPVVDLPGNPIAAHVGKQRVLVATNLGDVAVGPRGTITPLGCEPQ